MRDLASNRSLQTLHARQPTLVCSRRFHIQTQASGLSFSYHRKVTICGTILIDTDGASMNRRHFVSGLAAASTLCTLHEALGAVEYRTPI